MQLGKLHDGDIHRRRGGIVSKVPEAQRAMYKTQIDQTRKTWADMAKNASTKATMETTCKQTMDATKASLTAYGCSFRSAYVRLTVSGAGRGAARYVDI